MIVFLAKDVKLKKPLRFLLIIPLTRDVSLPLMARNKNAKHFYLAVRLAMIASATALPTFS